MLPGSGLERLVCSFNPTGESFAVATPDGRLRVFDTGTGRLTVTLSGRTAAQANGVVPNGGHHLAEVHTCLAWVAQKDKGKKKKAVGAYHLAVGTAAGDVKLYDAALGELKWRTSDVVQGGVRSISAGSGVVYATGSSCQIVSLDMAEGQVQQKFDASKYPISCVALAPDGKHAFGGASSMQLWDLWSEERCAKYAGHPTEVRTIVFSPATPHAASAASGERTVAVWEVPPAKKSKKQHPAVATLSLEDPAVQLDAAAHGADGFHLAAVTESGEAYVWACRKAAGAAAAADVAAPAVDAQLLMRVRVASGAARGASSGKDEVILGARIQATASGPAVLLARGTTAKPVFESLSIPAEPAAGGDDAAVVSLKPSGGALLGDGGSEPSTSGKKAALDKSQAAPGQMSGPGVTVLGHENMGQPVMTRLEASGRKRTAETDDPEAAAAAGDAAAPAGASSGAAGGAESDEEVLDLPEGEVPLGERVAALEARTLGVPPPADEEAGPSGMPAGSAKADSLSVLLTQAVRSNDRALLERCLAASNLTIIHNTVARIVPTDAALFLKAAVDRLVSKPNRAVQLVPWVKAVLHHHTGYLMSAPGVQPSLTSLFQAIDNRIKLHEPLLRVYGRLGLILHHTRDKGKLSPEQQRPTPEVVFEDDFNEPAAEDAFAPGEVSGDEDDDDEGSAGDDGSDDGDADEDNEFDDMLANGDADMGDDEEDLDDFLDDDDL